MNISQACVDLVKQFEGCKLEAYKDSVGIPTIGYGHIENVTMGDTITQDQADAWLALDLQSKADGMSKLLIADVTQNQFDALTSWAYNVGLGNARTSSLIRLINQGLADSAGEEFLKWSRAGGVELPGLLRRREAEKELYETA